MMNTPTNAPMAIPQDQGPPLLGQPVLGGNGPHPSPIQPFWQTLPPGMPGMGSQEQQGRTQQSENHWGPQNHPGVPRNPVSPDNLNMLGRADACLHLKISDETERSKLQPFSNIVHTSINSNTVPISDERQSSSMCHLSNRERMAETKSRRHHSQMVAPGHQFPGSHFPSDGPFSHVQHFQQHQEPHPSGQRQPAPHSSELFHSGLPPFEPHPHQPVPRPFEMPGGFSVPPPTQPFHPPEQHQDHNRPDSSLPRPHPVGQHPTGPHPLGHRFPAMPQQQLPQEAITSNPFSIQELNQPAVPSHHPPQSREGLEPYSQHQAPMPEKSQREKDEDWLKTWLRKHKIDQSEKAKDKKFKPISLGEGRQLVKDLLLALRQLNEQKDMMSRHINKDESSWQYECRRANRTKERVEALKAKVFSKEVTDQLDNKMKKTRRKRARLKRQRLEKYQAEQDVEARRKETHLKIDSELAKRLQAEQEKKREVELQEEVDKTLYEVRKKKQEVSQALELIKGLRKLRQLRKDAAQAKGIYTPRESDVNFDETLKPLEELMGKQSVLYQEEERVMQVMLEEEHEEYKEQEKRRQKKWLEEKAIKEMQAKMKLLFGKDESLRPDDPLFPFQQFYQQAENNVQALIDIRHQWDQFLVPQEDPEGSSVPVSWVLPSGPSCAAWATVLDT